MERAPFEGLRVVAETASLAGLLLARHLGDMGAEVAVIEPALAGAALAHRDALLRNTYSAGPAEGDARAALYAAADVVVADAPPADAGDGVIVVTVPPGLDETTDLPWLVAAAGAGAVAAALYRRRKQGVGSRIELRSDALTALLDVDAGAAPARPVVASPRDDAHLRARGFFEPVAGREIAAPPWLIGGTVAHTRTPAPAPGEHATELLRRFAGKRRA